jgi:hypothetical protein
MDPKEIRKRLGLPEDATDEQVQEALRELNTAAGMQATPNAVTDEGATAVSTNTPEERQVAQAATATASTPEPQVGGQGEPEPQPVAVAASTPATDDVVRLDRATFEQLRAGAQAGLDLRSETDKRNREDLVAAAIGDGRIPPSRREHWLAALEHDAEGMSAALASLAPGLVPVDERGSNETAEHAAMEGDAKLVQGWTDSLYPEIAARRARVTAIVSGAEPKPQIMREEGL